MLYRRMLRPALYRLGRGDPEGAHERALSWLTAVSTKPWLLSALKSRYAVSDPCRVFGLDFPNKVGLAAGMDKNGVALDAWASLGFGFVEVGTVTWRAQPGNPRPRLYELPASNALINRMGFNNEGAAAVAARFAGRKRPAVPVGISLGKSKATSLDRAVDDYAASFRTLYPFADYFAVNVSSPNTPGLRELQDAKALGEILGALAEENGHLAKGGPRKPILIKIAPDLTESAIGQALQVCMDNRAAGVIVANTTLGRDGVAATDLERAAQPGGMSGGPLRDISRSIVSFVYRQTGGRLPIIGVGGITAPEHAGALIDAGASLVQLYTGFIYSGPSLVRKAAKNVRKHSPRIRPRPQPYGQQGEPSHG